MTTRVRTLGLATAVLLAVTASGAQEPHVAGENGVSIPRVLERVPPLYPPAARVEAREGEVFLRVRVRKDGTVAAAQIVNATVKGLGFEEAAMDAIRLWQFESPMKDGEPVEALVLTTIEFDLDAAAGDRAVRRWKEHMTLGQDAMRLGAVQTAEKELRRAMHAAEALGPKDLRRAETQEGLAEVMWKRGRNEEAKGLFEEALALREEVQGPSHPALGHALWRLSEIHEALGQKAEAKALAARARSLRPVDAGS